MAENPQAFPRTLERWNGSYDHEKGMTLRDYFAGQALAGLLSEGGWKGDPYSHVGEWSYRFADIMLIEREKVNG